jgi:hypothetical protein
LQISPLCLVSPARKKIGAQPSRGKRLNKQHFDIEWLLLIAKPIMRGTLK